MKSELVLAMAKYAMRRDWLRFIKVLRLIEAEVKQTGHTRCARQLRDMLDEYLAMHMEFADEREKEYLQSRKNAEAVRSVARTKDVEAYEGLFPDEGSVITSRAEVVVQLGWDGNHPPDLDEKRALDLVRAAIGKMRRETNKKLMWCVTIPHMGTIVYVRFRVAPIPGSERLVETFDWDIRPTQETSDGEGQEHLLRDDQAADRKGIGSVEGSPGQLHGGHGHHDGDPEVGHGTD